MNPQFFTRTLLTTLAVLSSLPAFAQDHEPAAKENHAKAMTAPAVTFVQVTPKDLEQKFERLGVVEPSRVADVRARVRGYLAERTFKEGQYVEAGQLLYKIERDTFEATLMIREAELRDAQARLELAKREYERTERLSGTGAIAQERGDEAEIEVDRASAAVARAEAALREARLDMKYTEVLAPVSGIIGKALRDQGDLVDDSTANLLSTITRISPIYVTYGISEADYLELEKIDNMNLSKDVNFSIILKNREQFAETGTLNFQSPEFEASTGMLRIRVEFPNEKRTLRPNQFVKVIENHGIREAVITVPKQSVIQTGAGSAVFVIDDTDTLQFRPVTVANWQEENWEIVTGLQEGERVMVEGLLKSKPGSPVSPSPYTLPSQAQQ